MMSRQSAASSLVHGQLTPIYMVGKSHFYMPTPTTAASDEQEYSTAGVTGHKKLTAKQSYDPLNNQEIKVIIVGDGFTGKTALIEQFINQEFTWKYDATRTLKFRSKALHYKDDCYTLNIWDRPGDEKLLGCRDHDSEEFYRDAQAALVVYDLTRLEETLPNAVLWKKRVDSFVCKGFNQSIPMFLLGNKCDREEYHHDGASIAKLHEFNEHFRTSAKLRVGIDSALEKLVREVLKECPNIPKTFNMSKFI